MGSPEIKTSEKAQVLLL